MAYGMWFTARSDGSELSAYIFDVWHLHRTAILLTTLGFLGILYVYVALTQEREYAVALRARFDGPVVRSVETAEYPDDLPLAQKPTAATASKAASGPRRIRGTLRKGDEQTRGRSCPEAGCISQIQVLVFYSSLTGNTERRANEVAQALEKSLVEEEGGDGGDQLFLKPRLLDLAEVEYDEYFIQPPKTEQSSTRTVAHFYLFLLPSYDVDSINDNLLEHVRETHNDFRIDTAPLSGLVGYSVFGLGDREGWPTEEEGFCSQAKELDKWMAKLTARKRAYPLGMGDAKTDLAARLAEWTEGVQEVLHFAATTGSLGEGVSGSGDAMESGDEYASDGEHEDGIVSDSSDKTERPKRRKAAGDSVADVEDLGRIMRASQADGSASTGPAPIAVDFTTYRKLGKRPVATVKEMVPRDSATYKSLTKQGYHIVGSHSGVKICRWTKSAMRGRGSCYKFSFYGIASHQCMETTPSLSCSNKCVFCWRHGTNPVGTTWRWRVDPPELIFEGVKAGHYNKIKMMRGVPGVRAERFAEAMRIRHCALSLVGEPIFYPHINEFLAMLHRERISSFLVCNAQHPDQLAALQAVTQLYVSIDASNKESLRKIDRPLHRDFWERFQRCLDILRERRFRQRTVFRLTLVKGFNVEDEVAGYADLVERALPCFVEIKGVTYCGKSTSAGTGLTMANVPFYAEVTDFVEALAAKLQDRGLKYGIAAEHAHSCCVLIASERFEVDGKWHTRIDYDAFFNLLEQRGADGDWTPEEYMGDETPEWATWGQGGFDPRDERVDRKGRKIEV